MQVELNNTTKKLCVIGDPVLHSKSPLIQNTMIQALGLDYIYLCQPVKAGEAARWLEENSDPADIFATNRNNKTFAGSDGVFHFYTAASERRSYLESYRYALDYDNAYAETRRRLEQVSDAIFYRLGEEEAFRLAREEGVDWLLVSTQVEGWPQWQRTPGFANDAVRLYKVPA